MPDRDPPAYTVHRLDWTDAPLGAIPLPGGTMALRASFGSGLTRCPHDPPGIVWGVGDRGPNLKIRTMVALYVANWLEPLAATTGAKVMPRLDLGPRIARLEVAGNRVTLIEEIALTGDDARPVSGLPIPQGDHLLSEPPYDLDGKPIAPDSSGLDTEGIAASPDGGFWIGDEFGPSLVRIDAAGRVLGRFVPEAAVLAGARYPVHPVLPAIAAKRQLNRGFEAIALSADGKSLFLAFQSPLAHPDRQAHEQARHVRLWRLDATSLAVEAQYLYPLDPPGSFLRDAREERIGWSDLKVSELAWIGDDRLLVLERASRTTKIHRVQLSAACALPPEHLALATRPTIEELSGAGAPLPALAKELLFNSDEAPEMAADIEGMTLLSSTELLLVNDNDFGVEGAQTSFWKLEFRAPFY